LSVESAHADEDQRLTVLANLHFGRRALTIFPQALESLDSTLTCAALDDPLRHQFDRGTFGIRSPRIDS